jgi:hypothetical protein
LPTYTDFSSLQKFKNSIRKLNFNKYIRGQ